MRVHPGYGFLSENTAFARAAEAAGVRWIGPAPDSIDAMGDKQRARAIATAAGVPTLPGSPRFAAGELDGIEAAALDVGYPLLVKATGGGGGIGMRRVDSAGPVARLGGGHPATRGQSLWRRNHLPGAAGGPRAPH